MDILVSAAILKSLNAPFFFPSISDLSWETTLACTERDVDAKRSCGLLAIYSYLQQPLIRVAQNPPVHETLCEVILSNDILARLLYKAGVCDSWGSQEIEQASRAFLVFTEMVLVDRGIEEFASWFALTFDPIISVAVEACIEWGEPVYLCSSRTKRLFPVHEGRTSKRRRTLKNASEPMPLISTFDALRQLRQRQSDKSLKEIRVELEIPTGQDLDEDLKEQQLDYSSRPETPPPSCGRLAFGAVTPSDSWDAILESLLEPSTPVRDRNEMGREYGDVSFSPTVEPIHATPTAPSPPVALAPSLSPQCSPELQAHPAAYVSATSSSYKSTILAPYPVLLIPSSQQPTSSISPELQSRHASRIPSALSYRPTITVPTSVSVPSDFPQSTISTSQTHRPISSNRRVMDVFGASMIPSNPPQASLSSTSTSTSTSASPAPSTRPVADGSVIHRAPPAVIPRDLELEAVLFINETVDMVRCGVLVPRPIVAPTTTTPAAPTVRRPGEQDETAHRRRRSESHHHRSTTQPGTADRKPQSEGKPRPAKHRRSSTTQPSTLEEKSQSEDKRRHSENYRPLTTQPSAVDKKPQSENKRRRSDSSRPLTTQFSAVDNKPPSEKKRRLYDNHRPSTTKTSSISTRAKSNSHKSESKSTKAAETPLALRISSMPLMNRLDNIPRSPDRMSSSSQ
ncbi:hypothetical protein DFH08DRAFT_1072966 [Mycena albidolilacea]|uniref:Uncharacterized protein n=1 Tax=Mycena albidolilacea TaxID=1033008 RepID=A0AAD7F3N9_9AGAR|nr:hypothetical protein DFH08DRAFT_1072966 [Mycena albidolilacea]